MRAVRPHAHVPCICVPSWLVVAGGLHHGHSSCCQSLSNNAFTMGAWTNGTRDQSDYPERSKHSQGTISSAMFSALVVQNACWRKSLRVLACDKANRSVSTRFSRCSHLSIEAAYRGSALPALANTPMSDSHLCPAQQADAGAHPCQR